MPTSPASDNPYESPTTEQAERKTPVVWYRRLFMVAGGFCLLVAVLFAIAGVVGMMWTLEAMRTSTSPNASDLASGISRSSLLMYPAVSLVTVGCFLLVFGFWFRK